MLVKMESSRFQQTVTVANGWILDFMCCCLLRYFSEDMEEEFTAMRNAMNGFVQWPLTGGSGQIMKVHICQLLSRIVEAKNIDVQFDKDERITPLESALSVLVEMGDAQDVKKNHLYQKLKQLLQIQAVAVCMEKGDWRKASEVLERQFDGQGLSESEQSLKRKLSTIIIKKDPYHKFFQNFNHQHLIESAKDFADKFLSDKKSNFLVQAANKVVESKEQRNAFKKSSGDEEDPGKQRWQENHYEDLPQEETVDGEMNNTALKSQRPKKRLYSLVKPMTSTLVKPERIKDSRVKTPARNKRSSERLIKIEKQDESIISDYPKKKTRRRHWLSKEDQQLKKGVRRFGCGNWTTILQYYDFDNRTNIMLKDRWRTMKKLGIADSSDEN
ncbi:telomeric repeat-binding factor 1 isoform X2 [Callorhinchus milii]|nr:telomeric repeat-binding factor 1 isoform X2 [Callorhinchus milii]